MDFKEMYKETVDGLRPSSELVNRIRSNKEVEMRVPNIKKMVVLAMVACMLVGTTAFAASRIAGYEGWSSPDSAIVDYDETVKVAEKMGVAKDILQQFSNGYVFAISNVGGTTGLDEKGKTVAEGKTLEVAEKNILWLRLHTIGLQSHGSMPQKGKNAHLAACDLALRLNDLENFFDAEDELFSPSKSTFQPTKKETNVDTVNIIPGDDVFYMDCRILPCYTLDVVRAEIKKRVAEIEEKYGVKVEISEPQKSQSPATPVNAPVVEKLKQAIMDAHGKEAVPIGIGGGTVGAELRNLGFNAAIWSTIDEVCHQPDEYSYLHNTIADAQTLCALFLQK